MLRSALFRRLCMIIALAVSCYAAAIYLFAVPMVRTTIREREANATRKILRNIGALIQSRSTAIETHRANAVAGRKLVLRQLTQVQERLLAARYERAQGESLDEDAAKLAALADVRSLRYGDNDYFWVASYDSVLISHPDPRFHNVDASSLRDVNGQLVIPTMVASAIEQGEGFLSYYWTRLGEVTPVRKLSYFKNFPQWQWVIGSGVYLDDIDAEVAQLREQTTQDILQTLRDMSVSQEGHLYVVDSEGTILLHRNPDLEQEDCFGATDSAMGMPLVDALKEAAQAPEGMLHFTWDTHDREGGVSNEEEIAWVHYCPDFDWYVVSSTYASTLDRSTVALTGRILLVSVIALILSIGAAILVMNRLLGPIRRLSDMAIRVREGDLTARCDVTSTDELGLLGATLNSTVARIRSSVEELDNKVLERTAELAEANREALRAKDEAEAANKAKSAFLGNISHEMRTPLNGIIGFAELIQSADSVEDAHEQAHTVLAEAEHLLGLINDLLDHAKIEAGVIDLAQRPVDMATLVEGVVSTVRPRCVAKALALTATVHDGVPSLVMGDSLRLRQVIMNLVDNAIKFTDTGSVELAVKAVAWSGDRTMVRFSVSDTGIGMSAEQQRLMFDSFEQGDDTSTRRFGGVGIGASICRALVQLMNGQIGADSQLGEGTTVWFSVPLKRCAEPVAQPTEPPRGTDAPRGTSAGRILVAEDNRTNQEVARRHLERAGHSVRVVCNGEDAVAVSQSEPFDLILMDIQMPVMDGYEATRQISEEADRAGEVPILALTADASVETREACYAAGMREVLTKPVRRDVLVEAVDRWLAVRCDDGLRAESAGASRPVDTDVGADPLDYAEAENVFGSREAVEELVTHLLEDVAAQIERMRVALSEQDLETLEHIAHAIKGGASSIEAHPLAESARGIEALCKAHEAGGLEAHVDSFVAEYDRLVAYVGHGEAKAKETT